MYTISRTQAAQRGTTPFRVVPRIVLSPVALCSSPLYCLQSVEQHRTFFGWRRCRGEDWQPCGNAKCGRFMDRADRMFYRHARAMERRANWYSPYPVNGYKPLNRWRRFRLSEGGKTVRADEEESSSSSPSQKRDNSLDIGYDPQWDRIEREFEKLKRAIDNDPYGMVFGRRLQPFHSGYKPSPWSTFFRNMFGPGNAVFATSKDHIVRPADSDRPRATRGTNKVEIAASPSDKISFNFDPISGRMVPEKARDEEARSETSQLNNVAGRSEQGVKDGQSPGESEKDDLFNPEGFNSLEREEHLRATDGKPHKLPKDKFAKVDETDAKEKNGNTVFLMGEPQEAEKESIEKPTDGGDTSSIGGTVPNAETKENRSTNVSHLEDQGGKQPSGAESWTRSPQAVLSNFKDYLSSQIKTEDPKESPDTRGWPFLFRKRPQTRTSLRDEPFSQLNGRKDMEAEQLDTLRASDVRRSFQPREPEQDSEGLVTQPVKDQLKDSFEEPVRFGTTESQGVESVTAEYPVKPDEPSSTSESWFDNREGDQTSTNAARDEQKGAAILSTDTFKPDEVRSSLQGSPESIEAENDFKPAARAEEKVDTTLEDTIRQIYEESYGKIAPVNQDQNTPGAAETVGSAQTENADEKSAAFVTDACSGDTSIQASSKYGGETSTDPTIDDGQLLLPAQVEKLERLLVDIEQANAATAALLEGVRESVQTNAAREGPGRVGSNLESQSPAQYRVLAYDCLTREVKNASMMSASAVPFEPLHPADAVARLYNPSKFLPYFPALEAQGYELFSGGPEVLVFKRTGVADRTLDAANQPVHSPAQAARVEQESIDQVESAKDEAQSFSPPTPSSSTSSSGPSSGSSRKETQHPFLRKIARRMFLTGVITGGTCYAIGVVAEYFRTGGQDGLGPRGFTGLEGR